MATVKVSFQVGNRSGVTRGTGETGLDTFMEGLGELGAERIIEATEVDVRSLQARLDRTVARSLMRAVTHARMNIMGTVSASGSQLAPTQIFFETTDTKDGMEALPKAGAFYAKMAAKRLRGIDRIEWAPLSTRTRLAKMKSGLSRNDALRHYVHTGALRKELGSLAKNITDTTGTVRVDYIKNKAKKFSKYKAQQARVTMGQLRLTFLPSVPLNQMPGLRSGDPRDFDSTARFEKRLNISAESKKKLAGWEGGGRNVNRPLLQPILTYWMMNKTPELVADALARSLKGI